MNPFAGMSLRELELLSRFTAKAKPPAVLHRYRGASEWALKELSVPEVHVAGVDDMNDPFEYRAPISVDLGKLRTLMYEFSREKGMDEQAAQAEAILIDEGHSELLRGAMENLRLSSGLICCSSNPRLNRMWSYYGGAHRGICIGYSTEFSPFCFGREVTYADPEAPIDLLATLGLDPTLLSDQVSCRKGLEWAFEEEFRIPVGPFPDDHTRLLPITPEAIVEIRLGAMIDPDFKAEVITAAAALPCPPRIIQVGCDHNTFQLTEIPL